MPKAKLSYLWKRTKENTDELIKDFASRCNDGKPSELFTTDDYSCYKDAFLNAYYLSGQESRVVPEKHIKQNQICNMLLLRRVGNTRVKRKQGRVVSIGIRYMEQKMP